MIRYFYLSFWCNYIAIKGHWLSKWGISLYIVMADVTSNFTAMERKKSRLENYYNNYNNKQEFIQLHY